ncbi:MAG: lipid-A-disaccharide synthase [Gammaproteobacteria bacterium]|nr:lipid-A-disaccharide synthase [Gammaproteobacteria bacterium]
MTDADKKLRIGIVANEPSGDMLGAGLMRELRKVVPDITFEGVGGPCMEAEGMESLYPMERLTVMGLVEVVKHLPELLSIRRGLKRRFLAKPPDVFIGVDAPDFNLGLEKSLKSSGIPTVHYVSPTVWAWRPGRVNNIRASVDLMLSIFPFEEEFLKSHKVPVSYIGHPLADEIPIENDRSVARDNINIPSAGRVIAMLPGSRLSEIEALAATFLETARLCRAQAPDLQFLVPLINSRTRTAFEIVWREVAPELNVVLLDGASRDAMLSADAVLSASGTATLEALLLKRPMVVAYRVNSLTYRIVKTFNLVKTPFIAMSNLLAGEEVAPEFIQDAATPEALSSALLSILESPDKMDHIHSVYVSVHHQLRQNSSAKAAEAVLKLLEERG